MSYRWQYTNTLSILNRITGIAQSAGLFLFAYWLLAAANGAHAYRQALRFFTHPLTQVLLYAISFAYFYHLLNGVRHLVWDAGYGFERKTARLSGWIAFLGAVLLTVVFWMLVLARKAGGL